MPRVHTALTTGSLICGLLFAAAANATADPATPAPVPDPGSSHAASTAAGPPPIDHDGQYAVGSEILPGVYSSAGPSEEGTCYWRRIGADGVTLANALTKQPQVVTIEVTDVAFKTNGCQPWQPTDAAAAPPGQTPPWLSQLQLRHSLDILNGLAGQSGNGQLPPY